MAGFAAPLAWPLARAVLVSAAVVLSAPFTVQFRLWLGEVFPGRIVAIFSGAIALAVLAATAVALARIRRRRLARHAAIGAAVVLAVVYARAVRTGWPEVDVVERVHFVQYGIIGWAFYRAWRHLGDPAIVVLPLLAGLVVGSVEEWFQWFIPVRVGEAHDVALDLVAVGCGLLFVLGADPPASFTWRPARRSVAWVSGTGVVAIVVFAAFATTVHVGHDVTLGAATFRSHHTAAGLDRLARDRAERWRQAPPLRLRRVSREDQYMDEGLWHVRARNRAEGPWAAWHENLILERYFAPVLDTPSYVSATGHRWPMEQRRQVEAAAAGERRPYASRAEPYPLVAWPAGLVWTGAIAAASLLGWCANRARRRAGTI